MRAARNDTRGGRNGSALTCHPERTCPSMLFRPDVPRHVIPGGPVPACHCHENRRFSLAYVAFARPLAIPSGAQRSEESYVHVSEERPHGPIQECRGVLEETGLRFLALRLGMTNEGGLEWQMTAAWNDMGMGSERYAGRAERKRPDLSSRADVPQHVIPEERGILRPRQRGTAPRPGCRGVLEETGLRFLACGSELLMALRRPRMGMKMAAPPTVVPAQAGTQGWGGLDSRFRGSDGGSAVSLFSWQ